MTADFSTPTGSVNVSFPGQLRQFSDSGLLDPQPGNMPIQFSSPAGAPVNAFPGQLRTIG